MSVLPERSPARRAQLTPAEPVSPCSSDELEVLRAVLHLGVLHGAESGLWRPELRRETGLGHRQLGAHLKRLIRAGALAAHGLPLLRTVRLTDAGLATVAAAHGPLSVSTTSTRRRTR